jgi:hypothetical protein
MRALAIKIKFTNQMYFNKVAISTSGDHLQCLKNQLAQALLETNGTLLRYSNVLERDHYYQSASMFPTNKLKLLETLTALQDQRPYELAEVDGMGRVLIATQ